MFGILLAVLLACVEARSCPSNYQLLEDKCIRVVWIEQLTKLDVAFPMIREDCGTEGAHLPIIKSDQENGAFNRILVDLGDTSWSWIVLDMVCNTTTRRLEWIDGTSLNYIPSFSDNFAVDCTSKASVSDTEYRNWRIIGEEDTNPKTVLCVLDDYSTAPTTKATPITPTTAIRSSTQQSGSDQCGDYSLIPSSADGNKPCCKVFTESKTWENAQNRCATDFGSLVTINNVEENKFFWRIAISNGVISGMHIGAHQPTADPNKWTWIDGESAIDGNAYNNFIASFPIPGAGECSSMVTENTVGLWINEDCQQNDQPFMCRRSDFSNVPEDCPTSAPKAGEDFFPPGFPNSDTACEYFLAVTATKLVELEVMTLIAEDDKDFLELLEGSSGPHTIDNLTGSILTTMKIRTNKSNVMRVNWKPNGTGNGRGFRLRYKEVDA